MKFKLKKLYIFAIVCIISLIAAFGIKSVNSKKSDMSAEMRDFSLEKNIDIIDYYYGENDYDLKEEKSMIKDELKNASDNSVVVKVVPTGNTYANNGVIMQEVNVQKVYKGKCQYKKIWLRNTNSWIVMDKKGTVKLVGQDYNLMEKDNQYMVFGNNCKINKWSKKKILDLAENMNYNYFNLSNDYNKTVKSKKYNMGQEFYSDSSKILSYYNKLKKNIVGLYEK